MKRPKLLPILSLQCLFFLLFLSLPCLLLFISSSFFSQFHSLLFQKTLSLLSSFSLSLLFLLNQCCLFLLFFTLLASCCLLLVLLQLLQFGQTLQTFLFRLLLFTTTFHFFDDLVENCSCLILERSLTLR